MSIAYFIKIDGKGVNLMRTCGEATVRITPVEPMKHPPSLLSIAPIPAECGVHYLGKNIWAVQPDKDTTLLFKEIV